MKKSLSFLSSGKTMAVFQLESSGMRDLIKRLKPTKFEEITALLALYRPGPLNSGMHDEFVDRKHGKSPVTYPHKLLESVLEETYGVIVYQEQVMEAARVLAGFSLGQADILRRAMGKKKKEEMEEQREIFVKGCENNNIAPKNAEQIFDLINQFAEYGFNKSHSAAYALISYQTAYLKTYYPEHFMAAVLSSELGNTDKIHALIQECSRMKINVLNPNIQTSMKRFIVNKDLDIEYGLGAIKGVADAFIDHVCSIRNENHFKDLWNFSKKVDIKLGGKKSLEALSQAGAFDCLAPSRTIAIKSVQDMLRDGASNNNSGLQSGDLFSSIDDNFNPYEKYENITPLTLTEKLELEKKSLGYYLSGHPVTAIENKIRKIRSKKISELSNDTKTASLICLINSVRQIKDRKGKPLTFINFNDGTGSMDGIVSSETLESCHNILKEGEILSLKGTVDVDDYRTGDLGSLMFRMRVKEVLTVDSILNKRVKEVTIDINSSNANSLIKFSEYLDAFDKDFWKNGSCRLNVRVTSEQSEAIIEIGDEFKFTPSLESFFSLEDVFGKDIVEI
jgi:DNA polymerase-3 subunit alpha